MRRRHVIIRPEHDADRGVRARATACGLISKCRVANYRSPGRSSDSHRRGVGTHARGRGNGATRRANSFGRRAANIACTRISFLSMLFRRAASARASHRRASENRCRHAHSTSSRPLRYAITPLLWHPQSPRSTFPTVATYATGTRAAAARRCTTITEGRQDGARFDQFRRDRTGRSRARTGARARNTTHEKRGGAFLSLVLSSPENC